MEVMFRTFSRAVLAAIFLFVAISAYAADLIVLKDGTMIDAKVVEISSTEIRYKRANHLDGPNIVISRADVLSIRYDNGTVEVISGAAASGRANTQANVPSQTNTQVSASEGVPQVGQPNALQSILNTLPAITIAGNSLKFEFGGEAWVSKVNGENFSAGTITFEETETGGMLTLQQTHIWPGAVGKTAGKVANMIPGGGQVGSVLNAAGSIAGTLGAVEAPGTTIVLEYKAGPPASLKFISSKTDKPPKTAKADADPLGYNVFTAGQRWGTFWLNFLVPGLGTYTVMKEPINGTVQMVVGLGGMITWIAALNANIPYEKEYYDGYSYETETYYTWDFTGFMIGIGLHLSSALIYNTIFSASYGDRAPSNFTLGQRWGAFFLNMLVPGLGSHVVLKDPVNGTIQSIIGGGALIAWIAGANAQIPYGYGGEEEYYDSTTGQWSYRETTEYGPDYSLMIPAIIIYIANGLIYNAMASSIFNKAPGTASIIDPKAWNIALLPSRNGSINKVAVSYTMRF